MNGNIDDYAVNTGYGDSDTVKSSSGVSKDSIKVGVIQLLIPGAADIPIRMILVFRECSRILACRTVRLVRKINVDDSDEEATEKRR